MKWKEIKQQPNILPGPTVPCSCLVSFHFLWAILSTSTVYQIFLWIPSPIFDMPLGSQSSVAIETKSAVPRRARKEPNAGAQETRKTIADF